MNRRPTLAWSFVLPLTLAPLGCGDDAKPAADNGTPDTLAPDTSTDEVAQGDAREEVAPDDTSPTDTSAVDTADTSAGDTSTGDTSNCEYLENPLFLKCGLAHEQVLEWTAFGEGAEACAPYYSRTGREYATLEALVAAEGCEGECVYRPTIAVDFIRCGEGGRSGYEVFEAATEGCLDAVYRTPDGVFTDLCLWPAYLCWCTPE